MNKLTVKLMLFLLALSTTVSVAYCQNSSTTPSGSALYLFNNQAKNIPLRSLHDKKITSINTGSAFSIVFDSLLRKYADVKSFETSYYRTDSLNLDNLTGDYLKYYNCLIVQVTSQSLTDPEIIRFIAENQKRKNIIIAGFGELSSLKNLDFITGPVVWSTNLDADAASNVAQIIFGGIAVKGTLGKTISQKFKAGSGYSTEKTRLRYSTPEAVGLKSADLDSIDIIAAEAIREKATPSAVVMVIKDGNVIFNKAYGSHTYDGAEKTKLTDLYDLASVTKVSATTLSAMKLFEQGKIALDNTVGD
ncbi:MAG: serine hydrolase, partial [Bacteroidota bacterium]